MIFKKTKISNVLKRQLRAVVQNHLTKQLAHAFTNLFHGWPRGLQQRYVLSIYFNETNSFMIFDSELLETCNCHH